MERSFFLKKRRADFVAGSLSGRVIVAGGLGKDGASRLLLRVWSLVGTWRSLCMSRRRSWLLAHCLPTTLSQIIQNTPSLPRSYKRAPVCSFRPLTEGKLRPREHAGHAVNHGMQAC